MGKQNLHGAVPSRTSWLGEISVLVTRLGPQEKRRIYVSLLFHSLLLVGKLKTGFGKNGENKTGLNASSLGKPVCTESERH